MATNTNQQTQQNQQQPADNRMHFTVYNKRDSRVNDLIRRCKKSEVISLFGIDTMMLFRIEAAHVQFDMLNNHRPYILFHGKAEGVFLPATTGLLFPNMCDQLDFRKDYPVEAALSYSLSDVEIGTLANMGLFNYDWSCQGRLIGAQLEIPCKIDYYAIAGTPVTFIEIRDRLNLETSTRKTGYKTLVSAFLPYEAQKHNVEKFPEIAKAPDYNEDKSEIRKRMGYDPKSVGFAPELSEDVINGRGGASFVETAQERIRKKLAEQLAKANILETDAEHTSEQIAETVENIKKQTDKAKAQAAFGHDNIPVSETASLDAKLGDMRNRLTYETAQNIPVEKSHITSDPLIMPKNVDENDGIMTTPTTSSTLTPEAILEANKKAEEEKAARTARETANNIKNTVIQSQGEEEEIKTRSAVDEVMDLDAKMRGSTFDAEKTAGDVASKIKSRKELLAQRHNKQAQQARQNAEINKEDDATKGASTTGDALAENINPNDIMNSMFGVGG